MYFIARKSDKVVLYQAQTFEQFQSEWVACVENEGGSEQDYELYEKEEVVPRGMIATINAQDEVEYIPNPKLVVKRAARLVVKNKIKAAIPGLTDEDLALVGIK